MLVLRFFYRNRGGITDPTECATLQAMPDDIRPIVVDAATRREHLREKTVEGLHSLFPLVARDQDLHIENVRVKPAVYSSNDQKTAILHGRTLAEPVVGDLVLKDKTGKVIETKKNHILAHLPYFTERHSMIVGGNEYEVPSQLRLKPGVYTRERGNGQFEAAFNLSKGDNFRISMEPPSSAARWHTFFRGRNGKPQSFRQGLPSKLGETPSQGRHWRRNASGYSWSRRVDPPIEIKQLRRSQRRGFAYLRRDWLGKSLSIMIQQMPTVASKKDLGPPISAISSP